MSDESNGKNTPKTLTFYPFAYVLLDDELSNYCWYCLGEAEKLKKCTGCGVAYFCGKECQALGWKDHRVECKSLKDVKAKGDSIPDVEVRLLGRIVIRHLTIELGKDDTVPYFYHN
uniref:MYND-type domain-containing protein n=1 Tax=Plectus sambesii TaxID=2011161 RepID=A0A914WDL2_9BILA